MILNNKKRTINFQLRRFLLLFLTGGCIFIIYNVHYFRTPDVVISRGLLTVLVVSLFVLFYLTGILRNYHFFFYTDNGSKLVFRYYSLRPLNKKQSSVEIEKTTFYDFKIEKSLLGFKTELFLQQNLKGKIAKYPAINITLLNPKEINSLQTSLKGYVRSKVKH